MSCPHCGYCEHCGRSNYHHYYQPYRWNTYLTGSGTAAQGLGQTSGWAQTLTGQGVDNQGKLEELICKCKGETK